MLQKPKVVVILGATATGKSHCAIEIAKQFQGEIISGDSMLVYKNMNIGTANCRGAGGRTASSGGYSAAGCILQRCGF